MGTEFLQHGMVSRYGYPVARLPVWRDDANRTMKRLRLGAVLHFMIAIGHLGCLFALDEAGPYALSASGDIRRLPLTRMAIIVIIVLYSLRALAGGWVCVADFFADAQHHVSWLQFFSSIIPAFIAWCYYPGLKKTMPGAARAAKLVWMAES